MLLFLVFCFTLKKLNVLKQFTPYITNEIGLKPGQRTLLAVSGGADSVAMVALFKLANLPFAIAHVNFKLRGAESDGDEAFVRELAQKYGVPCFVRSFDTPSLAIGKNQSTQMLARELRYTWFEELRQAEGFDFIATAHHINDALETLLFNLVKGTGIAGLHGILPRKKHLIRPLLFASRANILAFLHQENLSYREDSSNQEDKYSRNFIRHQIIPPMKALNPSLEQTFQENIARFRETEVLYNWAIKKIGLNAR